MNAKFTRHAPGIYTDATNRWVISCEGRNWYSIRRCLGFGPLLDGVTMFPDMGGVWYSDHRTLADAKAEVLKMVADGFDPELPAGDANIMATNAERMAVR